MFSFLVHPKRYIRNPVVQSTLDELREPRPAIQPRQVWRQWLIYTAWFGIMLFVSIPLWLHVEAWEWMNRELALLYITVMGCAVFVFQIGLMIRTVSMALYVGGINADDDEGTMGARAILLSRWWAVCRAAAPWMLVLLPVKFSLAMGLSQYLYTAPVVDCLGSRFLGQLCYVSDPGVSFLNPGWMITAGMSLVAFAFLEAGISGATGLLFSALGRRQFSFGFSLAVAARLLIIGAGIGFWLICPVLGDTERVYSLTRESVQWYGVLKQVQIGIITFADGGTIAAADLMRINGEMLHHIAALSGMGLGLTLNVALLWATLGAAVVVCRFGRTAAQQRLEFRHRRQFAATAHDSPFEESVDERFPAWILEESLVE